MDAKKTRSAGTSPADRGK